MLRVVPLRRKLNTCLPTMHPMRRFTIVAEAPFAPSRRLSNTKTTRCGPLIDWNIQTAAQFGDKAYIVSTLEKSPDADVNAMDNVGRTALHWAIENKQTEAARILLDYAADPCIPEAASLRTPLFLAVKNNDVAGLDMLVERLSPEQVKGLCKATDRSGCTPLHWCRERQEDHEDALKWLLRKGAQFDNLT